MYEGATYYDLLMLALAALALVFAAVLAVMVFKGRKESGRGADLSRIADETARVAALVEQARKDLLDEQRRGAAELRQEHTSESARQRQEAGENFARSRTETGETLAGMRAEIGETLTGLRSETNETLTGLRTEMNETLTGLRTGMNETMAGIRAEMGEGLAKTRTELGQKLAQQAVESEQKLENIRTTMETRIRNMQEDNAKQLDRMRETVDEKLQKTLEERIGQSFRLVSERLEQVYKGLGEMQTLASGVGDLQKVLSNVKTRGILGEIQLGAILEEILTKEQYAENIATKPGSYDRVEFAVKLPGAGASDAPVWLPIDAKFPADPYARLMDAYESGDAAAVELAAKALDASVKNSAKTIQSKYVSPPATTDFAIMFLPFEGLYAEVVRRGLVEELQRAYKVNIAGPTTMAALLNSLQMGFRTLAIQKRSSEVWDVLGAVKTEFGKFEDVLKSAQKRLKQADEDLDKLIGTRTNAINRKLRSVTGLEGAGAAALLADGGSANYADGNADDADDADDAAGDAYDADSVGALLGNGMPGGTGDVGDAADAATMIGGGDAAGGVGESGLGGSAYGTDGR